VITVIVQDGQNSQCVMLPAVIEGQAHEWPAKSFRSGFDQEVVVCCEIPLGFYEMVNRHSLGLIRNLECLRITSPVR
jgi:hypothetical protein